LRVGLWVVSPNLLHAANEMLLGQVQPLHSVLRHDCIRGLGFGSGVDSWGFMIWDLGFRV